MVNNSTCDLHTTTHEMVVSSSYLDEGSQLIHKYFSTFTVMQGEDGYWLIPLTPHLPPFLQAEYFNEAAKSFY